MVYTHCILVNTTPSWNDLCKYVTSLYAPKWKEIGALLGLSSVALDIIELDNHKTVARCNAMFNKWLQLDRNAEWECLFKVIDEGD